MMGNKKVLFITPVMPSTKGRGRNHRAFQWVNYLSQKYDVSVLCTSVYGEYLYRDHEYLDQLNCEIFEWRHKHSLYQRIKNLFLLRPSIWNAKGRDLGDQFQRMNIPPPEIILCFRIQNASVALQAGAYWNVNNVWLDLDELDSRTRMNIVEIMVLRRCYLEAANTLINASLYSFREMRTLSQFDKIFTSTREEKREIKKKFRLNNVEVFENTLPVRFGPSIQPGPREPFRFLFVGNSSYFPNRDAIEVILFDIIPELKKIAGRPFRFVIIGETSGISSTNPFKKHPYVDFYEDVDDLENIYSRVHAVIVPLRAGGGSSLKFLEALRYHKPVVSSPVGARGFDVSHGEHVLIGKDTNEIATHCNSLMMNPDLAEKLADDGHQWFIENNSYEIEGMKERQPELKFEI